MKDCYGMTAPEYARKLFKRVGVERTPSIEDDQHEGCILRVGGYIEVYRGDVERVSIAGTETVPGFIMGRVLTRSHYPFDFDDTDFEEQDETEVLVSAVEWCVEAYLTDSVHMAAEEEDMRARAQEYRDGLR